MYTYVVYGLSLISEIELPELRGTETMVHCDPIPIEIRRGNVPHSIPHATKTVEGYLVREQEALFVMTGTARFLITKGKEIKVAAEEGHEPSWLRVVLLSGALGILLHQRGLMPLHASAVVSDGECVAFGGASGVGKSTLAAGLSNQGLRLLAEDKLVVRPEESRWMAWPGLPLLHLFANSAKYGGLSGESQASTSPRAGKYIHLDATRFDSVPRPFKLLYLLDWSPDDKSEPTITPISVTDAFFELRAFASLNGLISAMSRDAQFMQWATELLKDIPVFRFSRPRNYAQFEYGIQLLRSHWKSR
jgi:hypothetical protein